MKQTEATLLSEEWLSLEETKLALGITQRTIQKLVKAKHLKAKKQPRKGRGPETVYWKKDVERFAKEGAPRVPRPATPAKEPTAAVEATPKRQPAMIEAIEAFKLIAEELRAVQKEQAEEREREHAAAWLTLPEAASFLRLPKAYLQRAIVEERLPAIKAGAWRIRRASLEAFEG